MLRKIILILVFLAISVPFSALAQTNVPCTGTANPTNNSSVRYNFVQKTCTIQDNLARASGDEITFNLEVSPGNPSGGIFIRNGARIEAHTNCQLDGVTIPNGSRCSGALGTNGNRTSTVTLPGLQTLTVNHTVSNNGSSIEVTNAFGVPAPPPASSGVNFTIERISDTKAKFIGSGTTTISSNNVAAIGATINVGRELFIVTDSTMKFGASDLGNVRSRRGTDTLLFYSTLSIAPGDSVVGSAILTLQSGTWAAVGDEGATSHGGTWKMVVVPVILPTNPPKGIDANIKRISDKVAKFTFSGDPTVFNDVLAIRSVINGGTAREQIQFDGNSLRIGSAELSSSSIGNRGENALLIFNKGLKKGDNITGSVTLTLSSGTWAAVGTSDDTSQGGNWRMFADDTPKGVDMIIERISDTVANIKLSGNTIVDGAGLGISDVISGGTNLEKIQLTNNNATIAEFLLRGSTINDKSTGIFLTFVQTPEGSVAAGSVTLTLSSGTWNAAGTKGTTSQGGNWEMVASSPPPTGGSAQNIQCTGTVDPAKPATVIFDFAVKTCTINSGFPGIIENQISLQIIPFTGAPFGGFRGLGGPIVTHTNCDFDGVSKASGTECTGILKLSGDGTATVTIPGPNTLTVNYTASVAGGSIAITSAFGVAAPPSPVSAPPVKDNSAAIKDLHSSVSRSQSFVVSSNIGARLASASNSGAMDDPYIKENKLGMMGFKPVSPINSWEHDELESQEMSIRELAMMTSFDSSRLTLSAMGEDKTTGQDALRRSYMAGSQPITIWGHGSYISLNNNRNLIDDDRRYNGDVWGYNIGIDYRSQPGLIAGVSAGYSETEVNTAFNSGSYKETDYTFSPYVLYKPISELTLSVIGGYSFGYIKRTRDDTVKSNADSKLWFGNVDGAYNIRPLANIPLNFTPHVSFLMSRKTFDGYSESDGTIVNDAKADTLQLRPGLETSYNFKIRSISLQPFVKGDFVYDFKDPINDDKSSVDLGGGLRIASSETGLSGSFEWQRQFGRDDYDQYTLSGLVAYNFSIDGVGIASPYVTSSLNSYGNRQMKTGIKFVSESNVFNTQLGITRSFDSNETYDNTSMQFKAELKF